ncbi:MAG TPA: FHA domain-containing protein [Polyangiaceae bacterium]|jgi:predicted component of type VI protein secretion system
MRFRLRYLHHDLELSEGQFAVGRSAGCQLSLDDPLVSRRHALLIVSRDGVTIEDLQSRNGVLLNGQRIPGRTPVRAGDKIVIGSQELTLLEGRESAGRETASLQFGKRTLPKMPAAPELIAAERGSSLPPSLPSEPSSDPDAEPSMVRRADAFNLLGGVAEKALAMGRADEAERLLASPLADVVEASRAGKRLSPWLVDMAARFAAKLATATAKGAWADYVIELYDAQLRPCPAPVVDELYNAFRKVNAIDLVRLRGYVARLREKQAVLGPAERFLLQRLEGLERLAALR